MGKRFDGHTVRDFQASLEGGNALELEGWRASHTGSQMGRRDSLRGVVDRVLRSEGGLPVPVLHDDSADPVLRVLYSTPLPAAETPPHE